MANTTGLSKDDRDAEVGGKVQKDERARERPSDRRKVYIVHITVLLAVCCPLPLYSSRHSIFLGATVVSEHPVRFHSWTFYTRDHPSTPSVRVFFLDYNPLHLSPHTTADEEGRRIHERSFTLRTRRTARAPETQISISPYASDEGPLLSGYQLRYRRDTDL